MSGMWDGVGPEWDVESDPCEDKDPRTVSQIQKARAKYAAGVDCFVPGCPNKTTAAGILCMSHFMDGLKFKGGSHE